jgi:hypothetical protein
MEHLTSIATDLQNGTKGTRVTVGDLIKSIEGRGFSALILFPALLVVLPTGAIPGMPAICAIIIILFAGQRLFGLKQVYLPQKLMKISIPREKLDGLLKKSKPALKFVDRFIEDRLGFLCNPITEHIIAGLCIVLALTFFPLGIIPFAVLPPSMAILLMSLGLLARDGLLVLLGMAFITCLFFMLPALGLS